MAKQFSVNPLQKFICQYQASRQASTWHLVFLSWIFRYFPAFQIVILVEYPVHFILGKCLMDSQQVLFSFTEVWPYNFHLSL